MAMKRIMFLETVPPPPKGWRPKADTGTRVRLGQSAARIAEQRLAEQMGVRSDNTRTVVNQRAAQRAQNVARKQADISAEHAVRRRQERRTNPNFAEQEAKRQLNVELAKARQDGEVGVAARYAADAIDGAMMAASMLPGYGKLMGTTYFGLKGAKDLSQGDYLNGAINTMPIWATPLMRNCNALKNRYFLTQGYEPIQYVGNKSDLLDVYQKGAVNTSQGEISLNNPNVALYRKTPFGTFRVNKGNLRPQLVDDLKATPIRRRLVESAMRTTPAFNPLPQMWQGFKSMKNDRRLDIADYILTGKSYGADKGWYNSFALNPDEYYGGIRMNNHPNGGWQGVTPYTGDYIDAFVHGKVINPKYGLTLRPKNNSIFENYINKTYKKKDNLIRRYTTNNTRIDNINADDVKFVRKGEGNSDWDDGVFDTSGTFNNTFTTYTPDVGGYNRIYGKKLEESLDPFGEDFVKGSDIWKFNPKEYLKTHPINGTDLKTKVKRLINSAGLKYVDDTGIPIITETPWYRTIDLDKNLF